MIKTQLNLKLFFLVLSVNLGLFAQEKNHALNLYLPSIEFRFQDDSSQAQTLKTTSQLGIGIVLYENYSFGIEQSSFEEKTGNNTLSITEKITDTHFVFGYALYDLELQKENHFKIWLLGTLGRSRIDVETQLNNLKTNESNTEDAIGAGALIQLSLKSFLMEFDTRFVNSKSYSPESINISHLRFGYQFQF